MFLAIGLIALMGAVTGCRSFRQTEPPRTATEQLLLSTAANRALTNADFSWLKGKKIFVEDKYFESYDKGDAVSLIRQHLSAAGALLTTTNDKAEIIVEIRAGVLSVNSAQTLFGIPAATAPVPLAGAVPTPEIALYKSEKDDSVSKLALFAYKRESGEYIQASPPMIGYAYFHLFKLFGISWRRTDVPELKKHAADGKQTAP